MGGERRPTPETGDHRKAPCNKDRYICQPYLTRGDTQHGTSAESNLRDSRFSERLRNRLRRIRNLPHRQAAGGSAHGELRGVKPT
jgi:hypothetical protein